MTSLFGCKQNSPGDACKIRHKFCTGKQHNNLLVQQTSTTHCKCYSILPWKKVMPAWNCLNNNACWLHHHN